MSSANASTKPSTWRDRIARSDESMRINLIHNEVVAMFKTSNDNVLDNKIKENARKMMLDEAKDLPVDIMMFPCPVTNGMSIVHHTTKVGGTILDKEEFYFSLAGAGDTAIPLVYKPTALLTVTEITPPTWTTLNAAKTKEDLDNAALGRATVKLTSAQQIPPFLATAILSLDSPSPSDVFFHFKEAAEKFDTDATTPAGTEPSTTSLKTLLPYLWAAHKTQIPVVPSQYSVRPSIQLATAKLHGHLEDPAPSSPPTAPLDPDNSPITKMADSIQQLVEQNLMNKSASADNSNKKSFENRLSHIAKTLILTASAPNASTIPTEPSHECREFFEQKNAAEAKGHLYHKLVIMDKLPIHLQAGVATSLYSAYFFWDSMGTPSNFSLFLVPPESGSTVTDTADSIALSLKTSDGRGGIDGEDIKRLTKQKIFIPTNISDLMHHINHAIRILAIVFDKESYLVQQITTCLVHIKKNQATYCDLQRNDQLFSARLLYVIDVRIQNFFREAQQGHFDPVPLDFSRTFDEIVHNRTFKAHLPSCIHNSKNKKDKGRDKNDNEQDKKRQKTQGRFVRSPSVHPEWRIRPDERYGTTFHPHIRHIPKRHGIPICCKLQTLGHCHDGCNLCHKVIERNTQTFKEFDEFVTKCRAGNF